MLENKTKALNLRTSHILQRYPNKIRKNGIFLDQTDKIGKLEEADSPNVFCIQRAAAQYIVVNSRTDVCANVHLIAPGKDPAKIPEYKSLNKVVKFLRKTQTDGLR